MHDVDKWVLQRCIAVLHELAGQVKIERLAGPRDTVARLGGDEFQAVLPGTVDIGLLESLARVWFSDTDGQGVVYYGRYLPYFDYARVEYLRHLGLLVLADG